MDVFTEPRMKDTSADTVAYNSTRRTTAIALFSPLYRKRCHFLEIAHANVPSCWPTKIRSQSPHFRQIEGFSASCSRLQPPPDTPVLPPIQNRIRSSAANGERWKRSGGTKPP